MAERNDLEAGLVDVTGLQQYLRGFAAERDWEQFHTAKNLTMALVGEAGELAAVLQWVESQEANAAVAPNGPLRADFCDELADVMIYLARLADVAGVDLDQAVRNKMARNAHRFPPVDN